MRLKNKLSSFGSVLRYKLFNKTSPVIISWTITNRCNKKCLYCDLPNVKVEELSTDEILSIISELAKNKTQRIGFTGGEPLLRKDIGRIIDHCKKKGIFVGIVSNGSLVKKRINEIKNLDLLQLSIDGTKETNDAQRYNGSYNDIINSIKIAQNNNIRVWLTYVITKNNTDKEDYQHIIDLAKEFAIKVFFQPVVDYQNCGPHVKEIMPNAEKYKAMIHDLITMKRENNNSIGNSLTGLKELRSWPKLNKKKCYAGKLMAHIYPNGNLFPCFNLIYHKTLNSKKGFMSAFDKKSKDNSKFVDSCPGCWTYATNEFNNLLSLNLNTISNTIKLLK